MNEKLAGILERLKQPTLLYTLEKQDAETTRLSSYVGGHPYIEEIKHIPLCKTCNIPLKFVFQVHVPINTKRSDLYVFYYCYKCLPTGGNKGYKMLRYKNPTLKKSVESQALKSPVTYAEFKFKPYWSLPEWNSLPFIDINVQTEFQSVFGDQAEREYENAKDNMLQPWGFDSFSFYGGYANFLGFPTYPKCSHCNETMELFMQLDSNKDLNITWNEFGCIHIFRCSKSTDNFQIVIQ